MHRLLLLALVAAGLTAPAVDAGPWMRGKGEGFLSFGGYTDISGLDRAGLHTDPTVFLEYGLTDRVTLGLDVYVDTGWDKRTAQVFLRYPLRDGTDGWPVAANIGYGLRQNHAAGKVEQLARLGLSAGRGLASGWLSAEVAAIHAVDSGETEGKLDLTWGHDFTDVWTGVLQLQTGRDAAGDFYAKAAPSAVYRLNEDTRVEIGVTEGLTGVAGTDLRIATWWDF
mgnify:CR=1 FL=1